MITKESLDYQPVFGIDVELGEVISFTDSSGLIQTMKFHNYTHHHLFGETKIRASLLPGRPNIPDTYYWADDVHNFKVVRFEK